MTWISLNKEVQKASWLSFTDNSVSPCRHWCQRWCSVPKSNPVCISRRYWHLKLGRTFGCRRLFNKMPKGSEGCRRKCAVTDKILRRLQWVVGAMASSGQIFFNDMEMAVSHCLHFLSQRGWASSDNKSLLAAPLPRAVGPRSVTLEGWRQDAGGRHGDGNVVSVHGGGSEKV